MEQNASQPATSPPPAERVWTIVTARQHPITGAIESDPEALGIALAELQGILLRIGGVVQFASRRQELTDGRIETLAVVIRHRSFVPLDRSQVAPPREQEGTEAQAAMPPAPVPPDVADGAYVAGKEEVAPPPMDFETVPPEPVAAA